MTNYKTRFTAAIATGAVLLNALAPMAFAESISINVTGNGSDSNNTANVSSNTNTTVVQTNVSNISNNVNTTQNTGKNDANRNTNGNVNVETGNATSNVTVNNATNANHASVDNCCVNNANVTVSGNGDNSYNDVELNLGNNTTVAQDNVAAVNNNVDTYQNTGKNDANRNTGGDVSVDTGNATSSVTLNTKANANSAVVGGGNGSQAGQVSAWITGNGSDSYNDIDLNLGNAVALIQTNVAAVNNSVDVDQNTGKNDANRNTGGEVEIVTGDADSTVVVDNLVNFNGADVDGCACVTDLEAKIAGNGDSSDSEIDYNGNNALVAGQTNVGSLYNTPDVDQQTGKNDANRNTGEANDDPSLDTGNASSETEISNHANVNTVGDLGNLWEGVEFDFDFGGLSFLFWGLFAN